MKLKHQKYNKSQTEGKLIEQEDIEEKFPIFPKVITEASMRYILQQDINFLQMLWTIP